MKYFSVIFQYLLFDSLHYEKFADGSVKCIEDEIPFELPDGWCWARLKHICMMAAGKAKSSDQIKSEPFDGCYPCFGGNGIRGDMLRRAEYPPALDMQICNCYI
ncbi:hypothetical protein DXC28_10330 [Ruminococcus sp. OM08-9BH]|nr:hypothetical protein DXC28_10330 [Ruminococcus sp. OM08-9BH]